MDVDYFYSIGGLSVFALVTVYTREEPKEPKAPEKVTEEEADIQYILYLGTNDKDTNQPVYGQEEAKEKAKLRTNEKECANVLWAGALTIM